MAVFTVVAPNRFEGVYSVSVEGLEESAMPGIANIGIRPTVGGKEPLLEVHLFDYSREIYGSLISVTFHQKIREERQFSSIDKLKNQIFWSGPIF